MIPSQVDFAILDSTFDYMVRFLEGEHAKSGTISQNLRSAILENIRATMVWKDGARTQQEVELKVAELNGRMASIVSSL